jgi:predicted phosphodiesterase
MASLLGRRLAHQDLAPRLRALAVVAAVAGLFAAGPLAAAPPGPRPGGEPVRFTIEPYVQDAKPDGIVVAWTTSAVTSGVVRVELPTGRATFVAAPGLDHQVRLSGLTPGTRYRYVVAARRLGAEGTPETLAPPGEFTTVPLSGPFVFLVYGDNRDRDADHRAVITAMSSENPDFILQTGDMVSRASDDLQWQRYFAAASPLIHNTPMYPALGNHELRFDPEAYHFFRYFALPAGGTHRRRPVFYSFRYSNSLFVALDGNSPYDGEQAAWLERTLAAARGDAQLRHIFLFVHQPPYAVGAYCGSERLQRKIVPLLLQQPKVRAVFAGHEHAYQHLERQGIRYFVSGGGGAPLYHRSQSCNSEDDLALQLFRAEHHYLRVQVDGDAVTLTAVAKTREVMERVLLHKPVAPDVVAELPPKLLPAAPDELTLTPDPYLEPRLGGSRPHGRVAILWFSALALLAGLLLLTRPPPRRPRRADLQPGARRRSRPDGLDRHSGHSDHLSSSSSSSPPGPSDPLQK